MDIKPVNDGVVEWLYYISPQMYKWLREDFAPEVLRIEPSTLRQLTVEYGCHLGVWDETLRGLPGDLMIRVWTYDDGNDEALRSAQEMVSTLAAGTQHEFYDEDNQYRFWEWRPTTD